MHSHLLTSIIVASLLFVAGCTNNRNGPENTPNAPDSTDESIEQLALPPLTKEQFFWYYLGDVDCLMSSSEALIKPESKRPANLIDTLFHIDSRSETALTEIINDEGEPGKLDPRFIALVRDIVNKAEERPKAKKWKKRWPTRLLFRTMPAQDSVLSDHQLAALQEEIIVGPDTIILPWPLPLYTDSTGLYRRDRRPSAPDGRVEHDTLDKIWEENRKKADLLEKKSQEEGLLVDTLDGGTEYDPTRHLLARSTLYTLDWLLTSEDNEPRRIKLRRQICPEDDTKPDAATIKESIMKYSDLLVKEGILRAPISHLPDSVSFQAHPDKPTGLTYLDFSEDQLEVHYGCKIDSITIQMDEFPCGGFD